MLIEIHMIQNHSPSNLNRDDLGAPKTCLFGGVTRARISSQCLKRSIRNPVSADAGDQTRPGLASALPNNMGVRTKLFPWLVQEALAGSGIPEEDHRQVVMAAQRIASKKEEDGARGGPRRAMDPRPATAQLIHLGPGHARAFVDRLAKERADAIGVYEYFLSPQVGFQELVEQHLADAEVTEANAKKIVNNSWVVAKCRLKQLVDGSDEDQELPEDDAGQPGPALAAFLADRMRELSVADPKLFKDLTKGANNDEKAQIKEDTPPKPKGLSAFLQDLKRLSRTDAVDIALFGRMTTSDTVEDVEAAMQVAHAISTHAVISETDYFTAVDELAVGTGAGHVDEAMFNSACFYKYFSLDWDQLVRNLAGPKSHDAGATPRLEEDIRPAAERLAACALGHFLRAAAQTTPSGKQNSFAAHNEPCGILVEIKQSAVPTSYANAFAEPVERRGRPDDDGPDEQSLEGRSVACLGDHIGAIRKAYGIDSELYWYSPKLWRYPLQHWERAATGQRKEAMPLTDKCFDVLGGQAGKPSGLVEAVIERLGFDWSEVRRTDGAGTPES